MDKESKAREIVEGLNDSLTLKGNSGRGGIVLNEHQHRAPLRIIAGEKSDAGIERA
jgi:hypothetical protein